LTQTDVEQIVLPDDPSFGPEVQVDYPGYRSTRWRAPDRPLVTLPEELHELEGPVFGEEGAFVVTFATPVVLPAGHYFFVPQIQLSSGNFYWLSAPKPIVSPGTPLAVDLQAWIRNAGLAPNWLRIGTDIVGGAPAPTYNFTFSISGEDDRIFADGFGG